jgi:hypothetical protein
MKNGKKITGLTLIVILVVLSLIGLIVYLVLKKKEDKEDKKEEEKEDDDKNKSLVYLLGGRLGTMSSFENTGGTYTLSMNETSPIVKVFKIDNDSDSDDDSEFVKDITMDEFLNLSLWNYDNVLCYLKANDMYNGPNQYSVTFLSSRDSKPIIIPGNEYYSVDFYMIPINQENYNNLIAGAGKPIEGIIAVSDIDISKLTPQKLQNLKSISM